tara:strand:+ start:16 stop:432 length:417 start_codon:yes stop_codon:yes gene_type:complete
MVWNQYVFEATTGYESDNYSDDEFNEEVIEQSVEDWEIEFSDELHFMWNVLQTLLYDAHIEHSGKFCDFVEFCYLEHDEIPRVTWEYQEQTNWYEERINHIWKTIKRFIRGNGLRVEIMRGASFNNFVHYMKNIMCIY